MEIRPILLNSCARAATAAEARFRIDAPIPSRQGTCVVALDDGAEPALRRLAAMPWAAARFYGCEPAGDVQGSDGWLADIPLRGLDGGRRLLSDALRGADAVVMLATGDDGAAAASAIGEACTLRGIMTAGLVLGQRRELGAAVSALRPYARVLMVTDDEHDVAEVLTALRA